MSKYNPTQTQQLQELGSYLRQQRLDRSLTLEQIASTTFIRLALLKALEEGQVDELPERVYVQGFVRRYGDALNLDGYALSHQISPPQEELSPEITHELVAVPPVESMGEDLSSPSVRAEANPPKKKSSSTRTLTSVTEEEPSISSTPFSPKFRLYGLYALVLGGAVAGLFYLFSRSQSPKPSSQEQPQDQVTEVVKTSSTETQKSASKNLQGDAKKIIASQKPSSILEPIPPESQTPQETEGMAQQSPESREPEASSSFNATPSPNNTTPESSQLPTSSAADQNSPVVASVALEEDSWMRVKVDGKTEYEGILEKGTQQTWTAQETLIIRSGNAGAVTLAINNQPSQKLGNLGEVKEVTLTRDD